MQSSKLLRDRDFHCRWVIIDCAIAGSPRRQPIPHETKIVKMGDTIIDLEMTVARRWISMG